MKARTSPLFLFAILLLAACHKNSTPPPPPPVQPPIGTMNISLTFGAATDSFELIISEPGGKVLLDTITLQNAPVNATLQTNSKLVDETVIVYYPASGANASFYNLTVIKSVNLSDWATTYPGSYHISYGPNPPNYTVAQTVVKNFPSTAAYGSGVWSSFIFSAGPLNSFYLGTNPPSTLNLTYHRYSGNYNYFAAPGLGPGLYKLYMPANDHDTLDANRLDTLVTVTFDRTGAQFNRLFLGGSRFVAIPDTNNFGKSIDLLGGAVLSPFPHGDLVYPREPMQKYELYLDAYTSANEQLVYYSYSNTVPAAPVFPDVQSHTISSTANDNFGITFTGTKPSYCKSFWNNGKINVAMYSPPDTANVNLLSLLTKQKSRLLGGQTISDLALKGLWIENTDGLSYAGYFSYLCNPAQIKAHRVRQATAYYKDF